jgi:hypothetical protein
VAEQLWREQQLTGSRMTWNLTFQGFTLAAFVVTFGQTIDAHFAVLLRIAVCVAGAMVAFWTYSAVLASQEQRSYLKKIWYKLCQPDLLVEPDEYAYPRPFARDKHSKLGRRAPARILLTLMALWTIFLCLAVGSYFGWPNEWVWGYRPVGK